MIVENNDKDINIEDYGIRRLTPRECWRLMDFSDEECTSVRGRVPPWLCLIWGLAIAPAITFRWSCTIRATLPSQPIFARMIPTLSVDLILWDPRRLLV